MLRIVGHAELVLVEPDFADDHDRPAVVVARIGEQRRQVRRLPRLRLRVRDGGQRERAEPEEHSLPRRSAERAKAGHMTFFWAWRARIVASAMNNSALAM